MKQASDELISLRLVGAVMDRLSQGLEFLELNHNIVKSITGWNWIVYMFSKEN